LQSSSHRTATPASPPRSADAGGLTQSRVLRRTSRCENGCSCISNFQKHRRRSTAHRTDPGHPWIPAPNLRRRAPPPSASHLGGSAQVVEIDADTPQKSGRHRHGSFCSDARGWLRGQRLPQRREEHLPVGLRLRRPREEQRPPALGSTHRAAAWRRTGRGPGARRGPARARSSAPSSQALQAELLQANVDADVGGVGGARAIGRKPGEAELPGRPRLEGLKAMPPVRPHTDTSRRGSRTAAPCRRDAGVTRETLAAGRVAPSFSAVAGVGLDPSAFWERRFGVARSSAAVNSGNRGFRGPGAKAGLPVAATQRARACV
jgi:hypothetical protein